MNRNTSIIISSIFVVVLLHISSANAITLSQQLQQAEIEKLFSGQMGMYWNSPSLSAPTGIASYGIYKIGEEWKPQIILSKEIVARATINSLDAYNPNQAGSNPNSSTYMSNGMIHGANLQLNAMLYVKTTSGIQVLWLQNTNRFDIQDQQVNSPRDLILNETGTEMCNPVYELGGNGIAQASCKSTSQSSSSSSQLFYTFGNDFHPYQLPLKIINGILVKPILGKGVEVYFYNKPFGNGVFDTVLLPITNVLDADIVASPVTPHIPREPSDIEYVWTGFTAGHEATFKNMDSYLQLYYRGLNDKLDIFPSLFSFGSETAEKATNLQVIHSDYGPHVMVGTQNNGFFGEIDLNTNNQNSSSTSNANEANTGSQIPAWIKNNAKWWSQGTIDDSTFESGIQYLIQNGVIQVPQTVSTTSNGSQQIPQWVKNTARWWADGQLSDDEFIKAVQFMVSTGIIQINS